MKIFLLPLNTDKTLAAAARVHSEALKAWGVFDLSCAVRYRLVRAYIQFKDYDKATALARIAFEQDIDNPDEVQAILNIARIISKLGDKEKEEAARAYQAIIQKYPEHPQTYKAYEGVIISLLDMGKKKEAAQLVEDYTAKYAGKPEYMYSPDGEHAMFVPRAREIVKRLQRRGLVDEALTLAEALTAGVEKPSLELVQTLAVSRIKAGKLAEATAATEKLLNDYPMDEAGAMAVVEVAAALRETGQLDTAMGLYEYVIGITKGTKAETTARAGRAQIWVRQGKDEEVKAEVDAIIADANSLPEADKAVFMIGEEYYMVAQREPVRSNQEKAAEYYNKAIAVWEWNINQKVIKPFFGDSCYLSGVACREIGEYEQAIGYFELLLEKMPKFDRAWNAQFLIGYCLDKMYRQKQLTFDEAKPLVLDACVKLAELDPNSPASDMAGQLVNKYGNLEK